MLLGIILSFVASGAIGTVWYSKSAFGSVWVRHCRDAKNPECPPGAMMFTALGSAGTMILLARLFRYASSTCNPWDATYLPRYRSL